MKQVVVVSGKGGTGKTSLSAFWASRAKNAIMIDADVDASNMPLVFNGTIVEQQQYFGRDVAHVPQDLCQHCGKCAEACRFDAFRVTVGEDGLSYYEVDELACEGCTMCVYACPQNGITMIPHNAGKWFVSETDYGTLVHAELGVGQGNSGKLVTEVRKAGERLAAEQNRDLVVIDGPPGIGCQTTAAITGTDLAVVVTEPTGSGRHDMERILEVIGRMNIPAVVVVNKADLAPQYGQTIAAAAAKHGAEVVGSVPFFPELPHAMAMGTALKQPPKGFEELMSGIWRKIEAAIPEQLW